MPYCSKCGVEVDNHVLKCPLCSTAIQQYGQDTSGENAYPVIQKKNGMTSKQKRIIVWEILSLLLITAFLVVLTINLSTQGAITWASYPMTGIGAAWLYSTLLLLYIRSLVVIITGNFMATVGCLVLLDLFNGSLDWFLVLGLPIVGILALCIIIIIFMIRKMKELRANFLGWLLLLLGAVCIGLDLLISAYFSTVSLSWSFIVIASMYPIALLLFLFHYKLRKTMNIEKIFHV